MTLSDLGLKISVTKNFLNSEMLRLRTNQDTLSALGYRELLDKLDIIIEIERIGIRNLGDRDLRRITRLIGQFETYFKE